MMSFLILLQVTSPTNAPFVCLLQIMETPAKSNVFGVHPLLQFNAKKADDIHFERRSLMSESITTSFDLFADLACIKTTLCRGKDERFIWLSKLSGD